MTALKLIFLALTLSVGACSSIIQGAFISEAYGKYDLQEYDRTLELIISAENTHEITPEIKAELTYLKAQTHESIGQREIAITLYEYLAKEHSDSQYGYLAIEKLNSSL